jgi:glycosyltransferase involved in cell wall biosynthesis
VKFSVFLPVRNGWPYVRECVESVLAQSYPGLELTVLDNMSSDETLPWLSSVSDGRVSVIRSNEPLSIEQSWARIKGCSKQEFITMIGHDDVLDRDFLAIVSRLIGRHPRASLYQTGARLIDSTGRRIRSCQPVPDEESAAGYLEARFDLKREAFGTGFVMRGEDYDRVGGIPLFEKLFFADDALWLKLMSHSYKAADPAEAFSVRIHPGSASASLPSIWHPFLLSLGQYSDFLREMAQSDESIRAVVDRKFASFMLNRHRTVYLYASLEACQQGRVIDPGAMRLISESLRRIDPASTESLYRSSLARVMRAANASPLRRQVAWLWRMYSSLSKRAA